MKGCDFYYLETAFANKIAKLTKGRAIPQPPIPFEDNEPQEAPSPTPVLGPQPSAQKKDGILYNSLVSGLAPSTSNSGSGSSVSTMLFFC